MFTWFKVLMRISAEENYLEKSNKRLEQLKADIEKLEEKHKQSIAIVRETNAALTEGQAKLEKLQQDFQKISSEADGKIAQIKNETEKMSSSLGETLTACSKLAEDKLQEIKQQAEQYIGEVNAQIAGYEDNFKGFNKKLDELKQAVADFQR